MNMYKNTLINQIFIFFKSLLKEIKILIENLKIK